MNLMEFTSPKSRIYRCCCLRRRELNPLFRAVLSNDLNELKKLVEEGNPINIKNSKGILLINFVMRRKRVEIFDYLLSLEEIDINFLDRFEQSPLIYLTGVCFDEYFARRLIEKGADIHATDENGFNFLHLAARSDSDDTLEIGEEMIKKGININQQGEYGITPLYSACEVGSRDWICMLLYYDADVFITSKRKILPISILCENLNENDQFLQEILYNYTFDNLDFTIELSNLVATMTQSSNLFLQYMQHIKQIDYDYLDLQYFLSSLIHMKIDYLQLFIKKFDYIIKEIIDNFPLLDVLLRISKIGFPNLKEFLLVFLLSDYVEDFIQNSSIQSTISDLFYLFKNNQDEIILDEFTEIVTIMLTYGLQVTSNDLDVIYENYGNCQLFQILLHMDIIMLESETNSFAQFYYNPSVSIDNFSFTLDNSQQLIRFYNNHKLKQFILLNFTKNDEIYNRIQKIKQVPYLIELSRNAARQFIIKKFAIKNSIQFNTIIKWLPIGEMNRKILNLEKELY